MVKNTYIISALVLSMILGMASASSTYAQEYISTQSTELAQAIERAEAAKAAADEVKTDRAAQLSTFLSNAIAGASSSNADTATIIKTLEDATASTYLLLGQKPAQQTTSEAATTAKTSTESTARTSSRTQAATLAESTEAEQSMTLAEPDDVTVVALAETSAPSAIETNPASATQPAGTTISLQIAAEPSVEIATATPEENTIILATAQIDADNTMVDDATAPEAAEIPNTGEFKNNTIGKIIAIAMAAIVAMGGAILIVKRIKKNA